MTRFDAERFGVESSLPASQTLPEYRAQRAVKTNGLGYALDPATNEPMMAHPRSRKVREAYERHAQGHSHA